MARKGLNTDRIVEAAAELIAEKGFDQFSLRELSDRLGVKTASLYNHISSLSELWKPAVYQKRTSFILAGQYAVPCMDLLLWRKRAFLEKW